MENQDKNIDKHFRKLAEEQQPKSFQNMDKIWDKIEQKLDRKPTKKVVPLWKYAGIAAALLVFVSLGIRFINQPETDEHLPVENEKRIVIDEKKAKDILDQQTESKEDVYAYEDVEDKVVESEKEQVNDEKVFVQPEVKENSISQDNDDEITNSVKENEKIRITGVVRDADFGDPIPGVAITIEGSYIGTETDMDGKFVLNVKPDEKLKAVFPGFEPVILAVMDSVDVLNITMEESSSDNLDAIVMDTYSLSSKAVEGRAKSPFIQGLPQVSRGNILTKKETKKETIVSENSESYENFAENPFESAQTNPVSTFSIDVDNASYTNIRRFLNNGQTVPKDAVRIEEMINFFKYDYAQPKGKHPFAIHTEYSDAPWNPNHKLLKIGLKGKEIPTDK